MTWTLVSTAAEFGIAVEDLTVWVERRWVRPARVGAAQCEAACSGDDMAFDAADLARVRLIVDFHRDLAIDDEAMPVVLDLIDRLNAAREHLRTVLQAVAELPPRDQAAVRRRLLGEQET